MNIGKGTTVAFSGDEGVDIRVLGTVTDPAPVGPDGHIYDTIVEVTWADGMVEYLNRAELVAVVQ